MTNTTTTETETAISFDAACEWLRGSMHFTAENIDDLVGQAYRYSEQGRDLGLVAAEWDVPEYVVEAMIMATETVSLRQILSMYWAHAGLMDGLNGLDPDPRLEGHLHHGNNDYDLGWLTGCEMRESGFVVPKYFGYVDNLPTILCDSQVTVTKGTRITSLGPEPEKIAKRTCKVIVRSVDNGSPAYVNHSGELVLPTNPKVRYAGAGRFWHYVDLNDVPEAQ